MMERVCLLIPRFPQNLCGQFLGSRPRSSKPPLSRRLRYLVSKAYHPALNVSLPLAVAAWLLALPSEVPRITLPRTRVNKGKREGPDAAGFDTEHMCGKNIVASTYNLRAWRYTVETTANNIDKTARTAYEMAEAQRDSFEALAENFASAQRRSMGLADGGVGFAKRQEAD